MFNIATISDMIKSGHYLFRVIHRFTKEQDIKAGTIHPNESPILDESFKCISFYENPFDIIDYMFYLINGPDTSTIMVFDKKKLLELGVSKVKYTKHNVLSPTYIHEYSDYSYQKEWRSEDSIDITDLYLGFCNIKVYGNNGKVRIESY